MAGRWACDEELGEGLGSCMAGGWACEEELGESLGSGALPSGSSLLVLEGFLRACSVFLFLGGCL